MIPDLGLFCLALAFFSALATSALSFKAAYTHNLPLMRASETLFLWTTLWVGLACFALVMSFLRDDFSVLLVANHSAHTQPIFYKVAASWGNHEGSLLLWILVLALWGALLSRAQDIPLLYRNLSLGILALLLLAFLGFSLFTSNPFERLLPFPPLQGKGMNPLLQDPAMMLHPPLLYLGYVGFSVPFALAMAHLLVPRDAMDERWANWARIWALAAWVFLTIGITLGSWWAYYELGWGGFWFWDPVENASLMPWLLGTALIHSFHLASRYKVFHVWSIFLAISCFALSLLGAFLVRSGVLVSVHAFASDPARGVYLLLLFLLSVSIALTVMRTRAERHSLYSEFPSWGTRAYMLMVNNYLLGLCTAVTLCGTLFPLLAQSLGRGVWSVGAPYFNSVLLPVFLLLMLLMANAPNLGERRQTIPWSRYAVEIICSSVGALILYYMLWQLSATRASWWTLIVLALIVRLAWYSVSIAVRRQLGVGIAHLGVAVCALGIAASTNFGVARDLRLSLGESATVGGWSFLFEDVRSQKGQNYDAQALIVRVSPLAGHLLHPATRDYILTATKRRYLSQDSAMSEAGISGGLWQDLYLSPGQPDTLGAWTMRAQIKPLAPFIWLGGLLMAIGAALSLMLGMYSKWYKKKRIATVPMESI